MSLMSKEQLKQWIKEKNMQSVEDVQSALKELFADTLQEMLEAELETSLGYAKHDTKNKKTPTAGTATVRKRCVPSTATWSFRFRVIGPVSLSRPSSKRTKRT